jgi:hypothetical protein
MFDNFATTLSGNSERSSATRGQKSQVDEPGVLEYQLKLTEKQEPAEALETVRGLLDSRGLRGRYLIEDGWRTSGTLVSIFVNCSRVVEMLEKQDELVQRASHIKPSISTVCRHAAKVTHFVTSQHWESVHELMNIRLRFDSSELKQVLAQIDHMSGSGRDKRLAVATQANKVRKEAIKSIQSALVDEGLERRFTVPHAEWYGTHSALTIVGTATVRTRLDLLPKVTVERPSRTARGW